MPTRQANLGGISCVIVHNDIAWQTEPNCYHRISWPPEFAKIHLVNVETLRLNACCPCPIDAVRQCHGFGVTNTLMQSRFKQANVLGTQRLGRKPSGTRTALQCLKCLASHPRRSCFDLQDLRLRIAALTRGESCNSRGPSFCTSIPDRRQMNMQHLFRT